MWDDRQDDDFRILSTLPDLLARVQVSTFGASSGGIQWPNGDASRSPDNCVFLDGVARRAPGFTFSPGIAAPERRVFDALRKIGGGDFDPRQRTKLLTADACEQP